MNDIEAKEILKIMTTADGECQFCAEDLMTRFLKKFPEFKDIAKQIYKDKFNEELYKK